MGTELGGGVEMWVADVAAEEEEERMGKEKEKEKGKQEGVEKRVEGYWERELGEGEVRVWDVREVAPKKRMFCAEFRLPRLVAFAKKKN